MENQKSTCTCNFRLLALWEFYSELVPKGEQTFEYPLVERKGYSIEGETRDYRRVQVVSAQRRMCSRFPPANPGRVQTRAVKINEDTTESNAIAYRTLTFPPAQTQTRNGKRPWVSPVASARLVSNGEGAAVSDPGGALTSDAGPDGRSVPQ